MGHKIRLEECQILADMTSPSKTHVANVAVCFSASFLPLLASIMSSIIHSQNSAVEVRNNNINRTMPRGREEEQTGTAARRRRSRSPLRAVSKKSKSLMGNLVKGKKKPAVPDISFEDAAAKIAAKPTRSPARPGAGGAASKAGEDETVYGVVLDKGSKPLPAAAAATPTRPAAAPAAKATPAPAATPASPLQVVLLLMDPKTRRFELLQLEFDSDKAVVSDVLSQIALSATEESLRTQTYTGVADRTGAAKASTDLLSSFCQVNDVILAIPQGMQAAECAKLAKPILGDPKVNNMVRYYVQCIVFWLVLVLMC